MVVYTSKQRFQVYFSENDTYITVIEQEAQTLSRHAIHITEHYY